MKKITNIILGLLSLSALFSIAAFNVVPINQETIGTKAWSGSQTSSEGSYYSSVGVQSGEALRTTLKGIIGSGVQTSYDWSRYEAADEAEGESSKVLLVYTRTTMSKSAHVSGSTGWNREHSYPQSKIGSPATSDNHHIFASDNKVNGTRGNKIFDEVAVNATNQVKDSLGRLTDNYTTSSAFMPTPIARGEVARATMYLNTLYGYSVTGNFKSVELMIKWHLENPVTNREIYRNNTVFTLQKNRNPYIDRPEWACKVYGETNASTRQLCASGPVSSQPESIYVTPFSATVNLGDTTQIYATVNPSNASQDVTWSSSNPSIATVNNGLVTPVSVGQVSITATSTVKTTLKSTATITVTNDPIPVTGIQLDRTSASIAVGGTLQLNAQVLPSGATNKVVTWTTNNQSVVSVTSSGLVNALSIGTATVKATTSEGNYEDSVLITVTDKPITSSITGSFYNTESSTSAGTGGVTVANINNGISSINATGFGGTSVVKSLTVTQGYFPRSNGLALGSGNNSGILTLELNEEYFAYKVEAKFNNGGIDGTTAGLTGNGSVKSTTPGSIGSVGSNPSSGTAYVVEFNTPTSNITLTTSKRTVLVELVIHYGDGHTGGDTSLEDATSWAMDFLELTDEGCGNKSFTQLESVWQQAASSYDILTTEAKAIIVATSANGEGDYIEEAVARYGHIVNNYDLHKFITGLVVPQPGRHLVTGEANSTLFALFATTILTGVVVSYFVIKKKHKIN